MFSLTPKTLSDQMRGGIYLAGLSAWRMIRSRQTIINVLLLTMALLAAYAWSLHANKTSERFVREVVLPIYVSFLLPVFSLCYASVGIASDRQEQTLVYLLATPLSRVTIYVAKFVAALALVLVWNLAGFAAMGRIAGPAGWEACRLLWPAVFWASLAYTCLFHLFSVSLRRATVISVGYALFLETFLGNMPGIVKRVAISFYTQCLVFDMGLDIGLGPAGGHNPALFLPVTGEVARAVLWTLAVVLFLIGLVVFCRREYT
jgi:ABC-type transport system involved in multi-copper enzyme maturation permease subunit